MGFIILIIMIVLAQKAYVPLQAATLKWKQRWRLRNNMNVFKNPYIDTKAFYVNRFGKVPSMSYVNDIDVTKAYEYIVGECKDKMADVFQNCYLDQEKDKHFFTHTVFVLRNNIMIELSFKYAQVLHDSKTADYADKLLKAIGKMKAADKKEPFEINIITSSANGLELKSLEIKETSLNIDLYYNDDFAEVDAIIRKRLLQDNDKGIILLHGLPGTGKTTYLRHLIGTMKKKVLFVSPSVAGNLMNPEFIDILIDHPNAVLVIEDAENIITDRKINSNSSVSNLLNISDGLLSDCLNVQIICTFNNALNMVDSALLRKGRLIAKYEFGKLSADKAQRLSEHLGFKNTIRYAMTLAEVTNQHEQEFDTKQVNVIGFRRETVLEN